jgi:hypothetical protein
MKISEQAKLTKITGIISNTPSSMPDTTFRTMAMTPPGIAAAITNNTRIKTSSRAFVICPMILYVKTLADVKSNV